MSNKEDILRECIKKCKSCILHCNKMKGMKDCINTCFDCIICCELCLKYDFTKLAIEYCLGLIIINEIIYLTVSINDSNPIIVKIKLKNLQKYFI